MSDPFDKKERASWTMTAAIGNCYLCSKTNVPISGKLGEHTGVCNQCMLHHVSHVIVLDEKITKGCFSPPDSGSTPMTGSEHAFRLIQRMKSAGSTLYPESNKCYECDRPAGISCDCKKCEPGCCRVMCGDHRTHRASLSDGLVCNLCAYGHPQDEPEPTKDLQFDEHGNPKLIFGMSGFPAAKQIFEEKIEESKRLLRGDPPKELATTGRQLLQEYGYDALNDYLKIEKNVLLKFGDYSYSPTESLGRDLMHTWGVPFSLAPPEWSAEIKNLLKAQLNAAYQEHSVPDYHQVDAAIEHWRRRVQEHYGPCQFHIETCGSCQRVEIRFLDTRYYLLLDF